MMQTVNSFGADRKKK